MLKTLRPAGRFETENADVLGLSPLCSRIPTLRRHYKVLLTETGGATSS